MTKTQTIGYKGEESFYKQALRHNLPVIWRDRASKAKLVLQRNKLVWQHFSGLKWDFEIGFNKVEVKTSRNWSFNYKKNWPHFDYLVFIHKGWFRNRFFIIPRWELPSPQVINGDHSIQAQLWITLWEDRWDLLQN